jgi:hypothetical protein
VRRHDVAWVNFETPTAGQWLLNTSGNAKLRATLKQVGVDTSAYNGRAIFRVLDSISGVALFTDTGSYSGLRKGATVSATSTKMFPFIIAGAFKAEAVLERFTDLFPENDTLRTHFRVVYNAVSSLPNMEFILYPNPGNERLMVSTNQPIESMVLRDLSGKLLQAHSGSGPYVTEILAPGMYIVELQFAAGKAKAVWVKRD